MTKSRPTIHLLLPQEHAGGALAKSTLASIRLRVALFESFSGLNSLFVVTKGETVPASVNVVIACKPVFGEHAQYDRGNKWLEEINDCFDRGIPVLIDYTDHHLDSETPYKSLYQDAIKACTAVIVSSDHMKAALNQYFRGDIWTIEDAVDIPIAPPKTRLVGSEPTLLWFGHAVNIDFLVSLLKPERRDLNGSQLVILTDRVGAHIFMEAASRLKTRIHCKLFEWSLANMLAAAQLSDWAIIPSDPNHRTKRHVSTNRLIMAFAMGLPTAASRIPSYLPHAAYFRNIDQFLTLNDWTNLSQISALTTRAQREVLPQYSAQHLAAKWQSCVANYL